MANNTNDNKPLDSRQDAPLHRPSARIDAGQPNTGNDDELVKPPVNSHLVTPEVGKDIPAGQVTKM